jgi:hypothetical protein
MTADPLRDLFGAAPNADPLADLFGSAPNEDFATGIQPKPAPAASHRRSRARARARPRPRPARASQIRDVAHNTPSEPPEGGSASMSPTRRARAAGAVSTVGMGLRGLGPRVERIRSTCSAASSAQDNVDELHRPLARAGKPADGGCRAWARSRSHRRQARAPLQRAGQAVEDVSDTINVSPEKQQQVGNIIANATGQVAGLIGLGMVGGEGAVDTSILGQSFDQIDQALKEKGVKDRFRGRSDGDHGGAPVMAALERTGLDVILEGVPLKIKIRILRGFVDVTLTGGFEASKRWRSRSSRTSPPSSASTRTRRFATGPRPGEGILPERGRRLWRRRDRARHPRQVGRTLHRPAPEARSACARPERSVPTSRPRTRRARFRRTSSSRAR